MSHQKDNASNVMIAISPVLMVNHATFQHVAIEISFKSMVPAKHVQTIQVQHLINSAAKKLRTHAKTENLLLQKVTV